MDDIRPITTLQNVTGFSSYKPLDVAKSYKYEQVGRYHNYYFTKENWQFPELPPTKDDYCIDAFSPNLNKELHVGHLRQLALAGSFRRMYPASRFVAMYGASQGIKEDNNLQTWLNLVNYHPEEYQDIHLQPVELPLHAGEGEYEGCQVMNKTVTFCKDGRPNCQVMNKMVIFRKDGRPTYAYHDLCFAAQVNPTHYLTGAEQKEHFVGLGLGEKHLAMGLVLGLDGKKMKSRMGDSLTASEALQLTKDRLDDTQSRLELAWNVLVWNFLHVSRTKNVMFNVDEWTKPDAAGLYITYTYARLISALRRIDKIVLGDLNDRDVYLRGCGEYVKYYARRSRAAFDPAVLANYLHDFAKILNNVYHQERIADGRPGFQSSIMYATECLRTGMELLGMFQLDSV